VQREGQVLFGQHGAALARMGVRRLQGIGQ
jgi:hypothetical protein